MRHRRICFTIAIYKSEDNIEKNVCSWWMFRKCDKIKPRIFFDWCKRRARNWCIFICWRTFYVNENIHSNRNTNKWYTLFSLNQVSQASESHLCFWIMWYCIFKWKWKWKWNSFHKCSFFSNLFVIRFEINNER